MTEPKFQDPAGAKLEPIDRLPSGYRQVCVTLPLDEVIWLEHQVMKIRTENIKNRTGGLRSVEKVSKATIVKQLIREAMKVDEGNRST